MYRHGVVRKTFLAGTLLTITSVLLWTSCNGSMGSGGTITPPLGGGTAAVVNITDSPSDRVVSFEVTINSISLIASNGSSIVVFNTPRRLEVTHASGSSEPLGVTVFPQGTFTSAKVMVSSPDVTFVSMFGDFLEKANVGPTTEVTIPFNPPLVVGSSPLVLTIDFDAARSITLDPTTNRVTVVPVVTARLNEVPRNGGEDSEDGEFEHFVGQVTGVSGDSFVVNSRDVSVTFTTDANTRFSLASGISGLQNAVVRVEATTRQDGTPLAKEVEVLSAAGGEVEGLIGTTTGSPANNFSIIVQDASGPGVSNALLGGFITVLIHAGETGFRVDSGNIDLGGLNLPAFDASSLSQGQSVEVDLVENSSGSTLVADSVKLQQQALTGVISNASDSHFTITLPNDSALMLRTGIGTLNVLTQRNTELKNATISNGSSVRVRGLLFFDPNSNSFTLVAGRISAL